jgi:hypothetical protein
LTISNANPIQFWDIDDETFNEKAVCSIYATCFCLPFQCGDAVTIILTNPSGNETLKAYDVSGNQLGTTKDFAGDRYLFIPDDDWTQLCGNEVQFKIFEGVEAIYKSDCISFASVHDCTTLITYSNSKVFAGIDYVTGTPTPELNIRIPAIFFEEAFPDEHEEIDLSNSMSVRLMNKEKRQKKLDIGRMPFYMHQKMKLILAHDNIEIDGQSWIRTEAYEIAESNKKWPLRKASVLLNDKNYIVRNVL